MPDGSQLLGGAVAIGLIVLVYGAIIRWDLRRRKQIDELRDEIDALKAQRRSD